LFGGCGHQRKYQCDWRKTSEEGKSRKKEDDASSAATLMICGSRKTGKNRSNRELYKRSREKKI